MVPVFATVAVAVAVVEADGHHVAEPVEVEAPERLVAVLPADLPAEKEPVGDLDERLEVVGKAVGVVGGLPGADVVEGGAESQWAKGQKGQGMKSKGDGVRAST